MKKRILIVFAFLALLAVTLETYKGFFVPSATELSQQKNAEDGDYGAEKEDAKSKVKFCSTGCLLTTPSISSNEYYIHHLEQLPAPYTSELEIPPELS